MLESTYIHGYSDTEQQRLLAQAAYWKDQLILPGLNYRAGESLLEIGCAAGATLGVIGKAFPGLNLAGIDLESKQIQFAQKHLQQLELTGDLRVGSANHLPWSEENFTHVFIMWFLEHLQDAATVLREAYRVLKPGGTITIIETDYATFKTYPEAEECNYFFQAQYELFAKNGHPYIGRILGPLLLQVGFTNVQNKVAGFHFFNQPGDERLRKHVEYVSQFLGPEIPVMVTQLKKEDLRLQSGLKFFQSLPGKSHAAVSLTVYRANAVKKAMPL